MKEGGKRLIKGHHTLPHEGPLITVITVTYNAQACLKECIQSVADQSYPNIEHVILDGGSKDGTLQILEEFNDQITYWRSEPDQGIYDALLLIFYRLLSCILFIHQINIGLCYFFLFLSGEGAVLLEKILDHER